MAKKDLKEKLFGAGLLGLAMWVTNIVTGIIIGILALLLGLPTVNALLGGDINVLLTAGALLIIVLILAILSWILNGLILPMVIKVMDSLGVEVELK